MTNRLRVICAVVIVTSFIVGSAALMSPAAKAANGAVRMEKLGGSYCEPWFTHAGWICRNIGSVRDVSGLHCLYMCTLVGTPL
jgi:hypothetical protein